MIITSRWVLPIDRPPIERGWIEIVGHRIASVGAGRAPSGARDLGDVVILPGLVNAHTHLELSWMAGRVAPASSMDAWIRRLLEVRRAGAPGGDASIVKEARAGIKTMLATGTVLVGDISNTLATPALLHHAGLDGVVFHELLGFNAPSPGFVVQAAERAVREALAALEPVRCGPPHPRTTPQDVQPPSAAEIPVDAGWHQGTVRARVVAHAPYSVSPALFRAIARRESRVPLSVHLGESPEEMQFLRTGDGPIKAMLKSLGVWSDVWTAPGTDPVEYLAGLGYLQPGMLAVHATHLADDALARLRSAGAVVVTCPRSNAWVGAGLPRVSHFYASRVPVAIGTDSLASASSLNLFDELAELRRIAPDVAPSALLDSATRVGARALGFAATHGTIAPGKVAALVAVDVPAVVNDVEEYLVGGVPPSAIRRIS